MPVFNWNQKIQGVPDDWRTTQGEGIKIAIIDSGVDLTHPDLAHLADCRRFDVTHSDFNLQAEVLKANDTVTELPQTVHGTFCASVLAAKSTDEAGVVGIAPLAEIIIIKATDAQGASTNFNFLKAMQVAIREDVDVISVSYVPTGKFGFQQPLIKEVFRQIEEKKIALCIALDNTDIFSNLNDMRYPANESVAIATGVVTPALLSDQLEEEAFNSSIRWVFPFIDTRFCGENGSRKNEKSSCSVVNACFSGIVALLLAHLKKTEGNQYQRRSKAELLALLEVISAPLSHLKGNPTPDFRFYNPHQLSA